MEKTKKEIPSVPMLFPYEPEMFWEKMREIIREEIKNISLPNPKNLYDTPGLAYKPLFKIEEVCKIFNITKPTVYEWTKLGTLKPYKIHSRVFFLWDDIQQLLKKCP